MTAYNIGGDKMTKQIKADISLLLMTVIWGASFTLMKYSLGLFSPFTFLSYRYFIAGIVLCIIFYKSLKRLDRPTLKYGIIIGISLFGGCALQIIGLLYTTASKSGFLTGMNVVLVPLFLAARYKKMPPLFTMVSIVFAVIGLCLLTNNGTFTMNIGDVLTFLGAIFFAFQIIFIDKYAPGLDPIGLSIIEMLTVAVLSFIPALLFEGLNATFTLTSTASLLFTALFCSSLAFTVQMAMQKHTSPTHAALIFIAEPVFSIIFAYIFLKETLTLQGMLGCVLIFVGMLFSEINPQKEVQENAA